MSVICKVDGKEFPSEKALHMSLKGYGLNKVKYYQTYFERRDLLTNELINFKTKEQYLNSDFNDKNNMKKWLKQQPIEKAQEYCKQLLSKRKAEKNLTYSPSQVELRTIMAPSILFYNKIFDDYYDVCSTLALENRFIHPSNITDQFKNKLNKKSIIYVDTREQSWLKFDTKFEIKTLSVGDYSCSNDSKCFVERKSLSDFISTLSVKNFDRFKNEIDRAKKSGAYLIVIVEEKLSNALSFQYLPHISKKIKATPEYIFHNVRELLQNYDNLQFLFVDGRGEMTRVIESIFTSNCFYKQIDLQLAYDLKLL
jgi:hypothetical protein